MAANYQELLKYDEIKFDRILKVDFSEKHTLEMDSSIQENTSLMQNAPNNTEPVVIQMQTEKTVDSINAPVVPTYRIRFPIAITIISLLQIVLYVYDSMRRQNGNFSLSARILLFASEDKVEVWRYITYMFVHKDKFHLGLNIFFQLLGGIPLEITHGWWRITIVYLAGVLGGSLGVESLSSCAALCGASAGVYSILGAHFSSLILNWEKTQDRIIRIFILLIFVLTEIFNWMCIPQIIHNPEFRWSTCTLVSELTNSTITHVCGFIFGTLMAIVILKNNQVRSWERKTQAISLMVLIFIISFSICLIIFSPGFNIKSLIDTLEHNKRLARAY